MYLTNKNNIDSLPLINKENTEDTKYCLICWEPSCPNGENNIFKMKHITLFKYECKCDCNFHLLCFFKWVEKTKACPICREKITINNAILEKYGDIPKEKSIFNLLLRKINNITKLIFKYVSMLFLLHISIKIIAFIVSRF